MRIIEWLRLPGDLIFIGLGVVPVVITAGLAYLSMKKSAAAEQTLRFGQPRRR
jgi:nitric oxide reductase subunit B